MDFTVPLDRQTSRRPYQTYVVGGMEGSSQDDFELDSKEGTRRTRRSARPGCAKVAQDPAS
jgi:hypothetical protein